MDIPSILVLSISCIFFSVSVWTYWKRRIKVNHSDYINVLNYHTWKRIDLIQEEMENLYDGWLEPTEVVKALIHLRDEGFIEHRIVPNVIPEGVTHFHEFKRHTDGGDRASWTHPWDPTHSKSFEEEPAWRT